MQKQFKAVIGLEIHAQLATHSKIYSGDEVGFGGTPNVRVNPISLGHPGTLPTINTKCIEYAIRMGYALDCEISNYCYFARKNYFYPDLPKGYQITQDETPICYNGKIELRLSNNQKKIIRVERIQLEEDSGKSYHDQDLYDTLIDLNRAGIGLIEIVSYPDMETAEEAMVYLSEIRKMVRYLDICDGNMEEGSLRCDANISVMPFDSKILGTRCEVKNINSISNVGRAINYEIQRQIEQVTNGIPIIQETRTWDVSSSSTIVMREKEESSDYRYFPEPDLQPIKVTDEFLVDIKSSLPELPEAIFLRYLDVYKLPVHDAEQLSEQKELASFYDSMIKVFPNYKLASNWVLGSLKNYLNENAIDISSFPLSPEKFCEILVLIDENKISHTIAKEKLFSLLIEYPDHPAEDLAEKHNLLLNHNHDEIESYIQMIFSNNPDKVNAYKDGKKGLLGFFVGQVMQKTKGKADPKLLNQLVKERLEK